MKRVFLLFAGVAIFSTSCGFLPALTQQSYIMSNVPNESAASPLLGLAHNPRHLRATEHPGTGLYGYLNSFGAWVISPTFRYARDFNTDVGLAVVQNQNGYWGAINTLGQTAIQFNFTSSLDLDSAIRSITRGRYCGIDLWETRDPATNLWGYLDYYGKWALPPQYLSAKSMSDRGIAVVQFKDGRWGAINRQGQIVIQPNFTSSLDAESAVRHLRLN